MNDAGHDPYNSAAPAPRVADKLTFMEIWRPVWLGSEPRVFWRELLPPLDMSKARFQTLWRRGEWRVLNAEFARAVAQLPNPYFTLDDQPGVTFCVRRFRDKQASARDKEAVRALRIVALMPRPATPADVTVTVEQLCPTCEGKHMRCEESGTNCPTCDGAGKVPANATLPNGEPLT